MIVICLWQPFASLIFAGVKKHETRSFRYPKAFKGQRIAIHATAKFTPREMISNGLHNLCVETFGEGYRDTLPRSCLLGTVVLDEIIRTDTGHTLDGEDRSKTISREDIFSGDWSAGRYAWRLNEVKEFIPPINMPGKQGWWSVDLD